MPTATTTVKAIIAQHETVMRGLTPVSLSSVAYIVSRGERKFDEWCQMHPAACMRRFQFRDVGSYEAPLISNTDLEQVITTLELTMAYPLAFYQFQTDSSVPPGGIQDLEDVMREDMHQIRDAIGVNGYGSYASGLLSSKEEGLAFEEGEDVMFMVLPFETIFYRTMP